MARFARVAIRERNVFVALEGEAHRVLSAAPWLGGEPTGEIAPSSSRRLAPVEPSKILCVGRNYRAHAKELGNEVPAAPLLFFKPPSALVGPDASIELPPASISERIEHEAEIAVVVGRRLRRASTEEAARAVFGLTLALDVTARDLQKKDGQWTRAKGMDTFCPVGPDVVTGLDSGALAFECKVSGDVRQRGDTRSMIFDVPTVLSYASQVMTLEPGDLLLTGTPEGVGPLVAGDTVEVASHELGALRMTVVAAPTG